MNVRNYLQTQFEKLVRWVETYPNTFSMQMTVYYIRSRFAMLVAMLLLGVVVSACSGDDDDVVPINIPSEDDDICCTQDDERKISEILTNYKEVTGLSRQSVGDFTISLTEVPTTFLRFPSSWASPNTSAII